MKFFDKFCLPDEVSAVTLLFSMISLVVSIGVIVGEDDEPNKVEFVLIDFVINGVKHCIDII